MVVQKMDIEDRLCSLKVKHEGLKELMATIKDGRGASKVGFYTEL